MPTKRARDCDCECGYCDSCGYDVGIRRSNDVFVIDPHLAGSKVRMTWVLGNTVYKPQIFRNSLCLDSARINLLGLFLHNSEIYRISKS